MSRFLIGIQLVDVAFTNPREVRDANGAFL